MEPHNCCILVAEDNAIIHWEVTNALSSRGFCVLGASNGADALRLAYEHEGTIHVLVTDIQMPIMDGYQLANQLRLVRSSLQVLVVSALNEEDLPHGFNYHAWIGKPTTGDTVVSAVENLLMQHKAAIQ